MAQRTSSDIAMLRASWKFTRILSDSVKCWGLPEYEDVISLIADSRLWEVKLLVVPSDVY